MNEPHHIRWKSMITLGIIGALLGLFMLFFPDFASRIMVGLAGIAIILLSAIFIVEGLCIDAEGWPRWGILALGGLGLVIGVASIAVPSVLVFSTAVILGIFLLVYGIGELAIGIGFLFAEAMVRMVFIMLGIFSVVVGIFLIISPAMGLDILVRFIGLYLLVLGLMRTAHGLNERDAELNMTIKHL
jgi:uncharacterized membrane protein HdeD (DUF308 family)